MACSSRFSDFWVWQGQKDLNPRHAVLEWRPKGFTVVCRCEWFVIMSVFKPFSGCMSERLTVSLNCNKHQINTKQTLGNTAQNHAPVTMLRADERQRDRWNDCEESVTGSGKPETQQRGNSEALKWASVKKSSLDPARIKTLWNKIPFAKYKCSYTLNIGEYGHYSFQV